MNPKKETWYVWKEYRVGTGEDTPRLFIPWSDPHMYEYPFDFLYETIEQAEEARKDLTDEEESADWVLCKVTYEPVV